MCTPFYIFIYFNICLFLLEHGNNTSIQQYVNVCLVGIKINKVLVLVSNTCLDNGGNTLLVTGEWRPRNVLMEARVCCSHRQEFVAL